MSLDSFDLKLDEDSPDLDEVEVDQAISTESMANFVEQAIDFLRSQPAGNVTYEHRRRAGIYFWRISIGDAVRTFRVDWERA
jgi:hypothetical protein